MVAGALLTGPFAPLFLAGVAVLFVGIFANIHQFSKEGSLQREIDNAAPSAPSPENAN